ncbi:hypothetical protein [Arthrobacter sp. BE255]|uniref:hypothetical protein n=1 Tax=Arthrobacter sp. BE255 TaxID=2817721 RepID=UPI002856194A|nr:hypothetical protein [Arthrobacter sp. BE255]MDR7159180.1 hypothetical protein [Arthrobacter sp. BE255]
MSTNPVIRPKLATPALVLTSVVYLIAVAYLLVALIRGASPEILMVGCLALLVVAGTLGSIWLARIRRRRKWMVDAGEKWHYFDDARSSHRTTTEITVLSVDALEPTGSWITVNWNRFDHIQRAWIEATPDPIWPGSVVLMTPDPAQVSPGQPWPQTYYIRASDLLAWAPPKHPVSRLRTFPEQAQR